MTRKPQRRQDAVLDRKDWALLVLAAGEGAPLQPVHLQKCLFLIGENVNPEERNLSKAFYEFEPYDYGPFAQPVYSDAERLEAEGLATIFQRSGRGYREYAATTSGLARAKKLEEKLPEDVTDYVRRVVHWALPRSFNEIVRAIYKSYPEQRARSVFND